MTDDNNGGDKKSKPKVFLNEDQALQALLIAGEYLGWNIAIPTVDDDEVVVGVIVGRSEYVAWVMDHLPEELPNDLKMKLEDFEDEDEVGVEFIPDFGDNETKH